MQLSGYKSRPASHIHGRGYILVRPERISSLKVGLRKASAEAISPRKVSALFHERRGGGGVLGFGGLDEAFDAQRFHGAAHVFDGGVQVLGVARVEHPDGLAVAEHAGEPVGFGGEELLALLGVVSLKMNFFWRML